MVTEALSGAVGGVLLVLGARDYKIASDIRRDYGPLMNNPEKTRLVAAAAKQGLGNYKTFGRFDGVLTSIIKHHYSSALDKLIPKEEKEFSKETSGLKPKINITPIRG